MATTHLTTTVIHLMTAFVRIAWFNPDATILAGMASLRSSMWRLIEGVGFQRTSGIQCVLSGCVWCFSSLITMLR